MHRQRRRDEGDQNGAYKRNRGNDGYRDANTFSFGGGGGGGRDGMGSRQEKEVKQYRLEQECELRCEVPWDGTVSIQLISGTAEIFGAELAQSQSLTFPSGEKFAVFTWHGATIEVEGVPEVIYVADETPMLSYVNTHAVLEERRLEAQRASTSSASSGNSITGKPAGNSQTIPGTSPSNRLKNGPRAIVVGPTDSGKSSLCRLLLNYATRKGWKPLYVDLDIGQGSITMPGTVSAIPVYMPIDPLEGIPLEVPLVYYFGHTTPSVNADLYRQLVKQLSTLLDKLFSVNAEARASGMVINTMGWVEGLGYELILHAIDTLSVDVVLVIGQERLYSQLSNALRDAQHIDVVKLNKSGGVVTRNLKYRQRCRISRIQEYFYGLHAELKPQAHVASFSDVQVYRIGGGPRAPASALPIGATPTADTTRVVVVTISKELLHNVLGVSYAKGEDELLTSNIAGFIYVTDVNIPRRQIEYVAPYPGPLPSSILIAGSIAWVE